MIIINQGSKPYVITIASGEKFTAHANSKDEALGIFAEYIVSSEGKPLHFEKSMLEVMAEHSPWRNEDNPITAFADAHNLTPCGNSGIYLEIIEVEEPKCMKN